MGRDQTTVRLSRGMKRECRADRVGVAWRAPYPVRMCEQKWRTLRGSGRPLLAWVPAIAWAGLIFAFSAQPNLRFVPDAGLDFLVRKAGHMGVFGILALLLWRAMAGTTAWRRPWAWALALAVLYAASDELHQEACGADLAPLTINSARTGV